MESSLSLSSLQQSFTYLKTIIMFNTMQAFSAEHDFQCSKITREISTTLPSAPRNWTLNGDCAWSNLLLEICCSGREKELEIELWRESFIIHLSQWIWSAQLKHSHIIFMGFYLYFIYICFCKFYDAVKDTACVLECMSNLDRFPAVM